MNAIKKYLLLTCLLILSASIATAATLDLTYNGKPVDQSLEVHFKFMDNSYGPTAGRMDISLDGFSDTAFCIELGPEAAGGKITLGNPIDYWSGIGTGQNALYASWLMDQYNPSFGYTKSGMSEKVTYAALQLAIWDTIYDFNFDGTSYSYSGTNFLSLSEVWGTPAWETDEELNAWALAEDHKASLVAAMEDGSISDNFSGKYNFFVADFDSNNNTHGGTSQEMLIASPVPEPATMMLFGIGLLGLAGLGRKKSV